MNLQNCLCSRDFKSCLNINYKGLNISVYLKNDINNVTSDEIENAIMHEIELYKERAEDAKNKIEILHAETLEAVKIFNNVFDKSKNFKTNILRKIIENRLYKL